jgi:hypothetical protein
MDGLLIKLLADAGRPGFWFWKLFAPIRQDLDRLFWCFPCQPWMGPPDEFVKDDAATNASFVGARTSMTQLWNPGSLGRYADRFGEEQIELWGIESTVDDPTQVAKEYDSTPWRERERIIRQFARVWLIYTDGVWEIYARKPRLLEDIRQHLHGKETVSVYKSHVDRRADAFGRAGLSHVWKNLYKS